MSARYLVRKLGWALLTLWFILTANFFLFRVMPGDPVALLARSQRLSASALEHQRQVFGLDQPLLAQYVTYLLVGLGTALAALIGVLAGIRSGWERGGAFDRGGLYSSLILYATPEGWLGMILLIVFAGSLGWFPAGGYSSDPDAGPGDVLLHLALPVLTLTLGYVGQFMIVMRSSMIEVKGEDYLVLARAKGLSDSRVRRHHAVPNAFLPSFTLIVLSFGFVLGGAIVVETVYSWPGLGLLTYQSIKDQDYPVLQAVFLLSSTAVILANLLADITYGFLDPRVESV